MTERNPDRDGVSEATRAEEEREAHVQADPGAQPTAGEEQAADAQRGLADGSVAEHEREMLERGAHARGEGKIV